MSKLTLVRQKLVDRPDVSIVSPPDPDYLPHLGRNQYIPFFVAPENGLYTAADLREFMEGLVPDSLEPTSMHAFREVDGTLYFGEMYFSEKIGEYRKGEIYQLTDEDLFNAEGFKDGRKIQKRKEDMMRTTLVRPYPSVEIAANMSGGLLDYFPQISLKDLRKYERGPGFFKRLFSSSGRLETPVTPASGF